MGGDWWSTASGTTAAGGFGALATNLEFTQVSADGDGSPYGFAIRITGAAEFFVDGTWAYTAP